MELCWQISAETLCALYCLNRYISFPATPLRLFARNFANNFSYSLALVLFAGDCISFAQ